MPAVWTQPEIESLADPRSFGRGRAYQREGRVEVERQDAVCVVAVVRGASAPPKGKVDDEPDLRRYLSGLDRGELVDVVLDQVESDWRLRERLVARAIASGGGSLDVGAWRKRIDTVFGDRRRFVDYAEAGGWAQDVLDVVAALDDLVDAGHATAVVGLAEHAHRRAEAAIQYVESRARRAA
jgi:hypothetical protein